MHTHPLTRRTLMGAALTSASAAFLAGCSSSSNEAAPTSEPTAAVSANPTILVVSFGTSYASSRHCTIGAIESDIREAYPGYNVRRAFTSQIIIDHIESDTGRHIDSFEEAMDKLVAEGTREVIVQPTHLMDGFEYQDVVAAIEDYRDKIDIIKCGSPLLATDEDKVAVAEALKEAMAGYEAEDTAIVLMGHGTEAESNAIYSEMQEVFDRLGYDDFIITTVEAEPDFEDAVSRVTEAGFAKVVLRPFMVVAGDHATNDMADEADPESLASLMKAAGLEVTSIIEGLGQLSTIDEIYVSHVQQAIDA